MADFIGSTSAIIKWCVETDAREFIVMTESGVRYSLEVYPGVAHGFAVSDVPVYDREASERHWERIVSLFGETLS